MSFRYQDILASLIDDTEELTTVTSRIGIT